MDKLFRSTRLAPALCAVTITTVSVVCIGDQLFSPRIFSMLYSWPMRTSTPAFAITLPSQKKRLSIVISLFRKYAGLTLSPYDAVDGNRLPPSPQNRSLTAGERGLRETMKKFFAMTLERNYNEVFLFEDDAIPHLNFTQLFKQLPSRCQEADLLLLGATMFLRK